MGFNMIDHLQNLRRAVELSRLSVEQGSSPFGTVIVNARGEIVGEGHNRVALDNDPTAHGEVTAIRNACRNLNTFDLSGCILYTSCEPCPMCLNACKWANIAEVYYAADRNDADDIGFRDKLFYEKDTLELHHLKVDEAVDIMKEWYQKEDKIKY